MSPSSLLAESTSPRQKGTPMVKLRLSWRLLQVAMHLALGALLTLAAAPIARSPSARTVQGWHAGLCRILELRVQIQGEPLKEGAVLVSNHVSWLDIPVLGSRLPASFIAKSDVRAWPLIGGLSARAGTLFLRRGGRDLQEGSAAMTRLLARGASLALFPEGTTTSDL